MSPRPRIATKNMLSTEYSLQTFEVTSISPKGASKLPVIDAQMAKLRADIRDLTARLQRASEEGRAAA